MIDLHCHSTFSDGSERPEALATMANRLGLSAVALTDHDTLDGLDAFLSQQPSVSTRLIAGIELSCGFAGLDLHVLGLFIRHRDPIFQERVNSLGLRRFKRNAEIFQKLNRHRININPKEYAKNKKVGLITRAHIADMLLEAGYAETKEEIFQKYLGETGLAYTPFEFLPPRDAFTWIREAGGLPVVAHPGRFSRGFIWDAAMADLRDCGATGIETYHSDHSDGETKYFLKLCKTLGMAPSGGSDFHGRCKRGCKLGTGWGNLNVQDDVLAGLEKMLELPIKLS
jgi:predicted metal-dependent phosphoesterase TrpH